MDRHRLSMQVAGSLATPLLTWLALPGRFSCWPLLLICLVPLLLSVAVAPSYRQAFGRGLAAGILFYLLQIYWIVPVLMNYGHLPWYLAVPALLLLAGYMGLYLGVFCVGFRRLMERGPGLSCLFGAAALWVGLDWLRSWLFSGFPWMDLGYGFWASPRLIQAADLFGHYGYTFFVVLVNVALYQVLAFRSMPRRSATGVVAVAVICALLGGYVQLRWHQIEERLSHAETPLVGIVQGNVEQDRKWSPAERERTVRNYLDLSEALRTAAAPELIVWPETALPFYPRNSELMLPVLDFVGQKRQPLLTGAPWYEVFEEGGSRLIYYYNSALLLQPGEQTETKYFKSHLVPFGEYVPLRRFLPFIAPLVEAAGHFTPGRIEEPLVTGPIRAGVLICFESIFGELGRRWVASGANVLVNVTNDAWYGRSSAPYQSWAMTIFRSVETRRSLVRSANTGISGVVDPLGRIVRQSDLFVPWSAVTPVVLLEERSPFVRGGHLFAPLSALAAVLILLPGVKRTQRSD